MIGSFHAFSIFISTTIFMIHYVTEIVEQIFNHQVINHRREALSFILQFRRRQKKTLHNLVTIKYSQANFLVADYLSNRQLCDR